MNTDVEEVLAEMTRRLVREFSPEQVILFGSHAWGAPDADSDVDLLVVVRDSDEAPTHRDARAHLSLSGLGVPKDILVQTRAELDGARHVRASLENLVVEKGRVLYRE